MESLLLWGSTKPKGYSLSQSQHEKVDGAAVEARPRCSVLGCERDSDATLELKRLCVAHVIITCYQKLEEMNKATHMWSVGGPAWEAARGFVLECVDVSTNLSDRHPPFPNMERARLADIAIWATELGRKLRRSPRSLLSIPVRLISRRPGNIWEQETSTVDISSHGARVMCQYALKKNDILKVLRLDTLEEVEARVVWQHEVESGDQEIGIEFLSGGGLAAG
jgi:hypothetical protein